MKFGAGRIQRRHGLLVLLALMLGVLLAGYRERAAIAAVVRRAVSPAQDPEIDWTRVSERDLNIASVFLVTRDRGVRAGLDSLERVMASDPALEPRGHALAHAMGRYAMASRKDLAMLGECTPSFQSGCFHGAMEGYFLQGGTVERASIGEVCASRAVPGVRGFELRECWHGLGHGLMVKFGGDVRQALPLCDALERPEARRECQDGAFMERASRAAGARTIDVGDGPAMAQSHAHGAEHAGAGHGEAAGHPAPAGGKERAAPAAFCNGFAERHQPACWAYQAPVLAGALGRSPERILRACDQAPAVAVGDCYRGLGKNLGAWHRDARPMIQGCGAGNPTRVTDCLEGGVEYFTDLRWDVAPGIAFCGQIPAASKPRCYEVIGQRLALLHPDPRSAAAACKAVEPAFAAACMAGARRQPP